MQKYKWNSKISTMMLEKSHLGYFSWNDKTGIFFHFFFQSVPFILQCVGDTSSLDTFFFTIDSSYKTILKIKQKFRLQAMVNITIDTKTKV